MAGMLTRDDLKGMSPAEIDKATREGRIEGVGNGTPRGELTGLGPDGDKPTTSRRGQKSRADMLDLDPQQFEEMLTAGSFDSVLEGATHVLDCATGTVYEVTGTNDGDLSPMVKAEDAAGEEREELAEKLFTDWVPLTGDIYVKAAEVIDDSSTKASKYKLPLKPGQAEAITSGQLIVVDPDTAKPLSRVSDKKEQTA